MKRLLLLAFVIVAGVVNLHAQGHQIKRPGSSQPAQQQPAQQQPATKPPKPPTPKPPAQSTVQKPPKPPTPAEKPAPKPAVATPSQAEYDEVVDSWDIDEYDNFLRKYPSGNMSNEIRKRRDEVELWEEAVEANTVMAYDIYLENTLLAHFEDEANEALERLLSGDMQSDWEDACKANTIDAYSRFISHNPDSKYAAEAKKRMNNLQGERDWLDVKRSYDLGRYESYLEKYPDSKYRREAENLIAAEKGLQAYKNGNSPKAAEYFDAVSDKDLLTDYRYMESYKKTKEESIYPTLSEYSSPSELRSFLALYPKSRYRDAVEEYLALSLCRNFNRNSTELDYQEALHYVKDPENRKRIEAAIKENKKYQK